MKLEKDIYQYLDSMIACAYEYENIVAQLISKTNINNFYHAIRMLELALLEVKP